MAMILTCQKIKFGGVNTIYKHYDIFCAISIDMYPNKSMDRKVIDTHEILKQEIHKRTADEGSLYRFGMLPKYPSVASPPHVDDVGFEDVEIYFDTIHRDRTTEISNGELSWNIPPLNFDLSISNCIQIHLNEFYLPNVLTDIGEPDFFYYRRVFLEYRDAPNNQAVLGANGNRFHFEFAVENITGQAVRLVPLKNSFFFNRPINTLSSFRIRFAVPATSPTSFRRVPIPNDLINVTTELLGGLGYNPIRFRITGDLTNVIGRVGVLSTPVAVTFTNYQSNVPLVNNQINNPDGIFVTNIIDDNVFEIAGINGNTVNIPAAATMLVMKNRIAFPVRFTSVVDRPTNYIDVNHS